MSQRAKLLVAAALMALSLVIGYWIGKSERRPPQDLLDAIVVVQRRSPMFLITEQRPGEGWLGRGVAFLCSSPRALAELERMITPPRNAVPVEGVVCFKGTDEPVVSPWLESGRCLRYERFAAFGDPALLKVVQKALADAGLHPKPRPSPASGADDGAELRDQ